MKEKRETMPFTLTLNGVIALLLRYFTEFDSFAGRYVTVVEDRPIMSV